MEEGRCFTVWPSYLEALSELNDQQRLDVYDAMFIYGIRGEEPDFLDDPGSRAVFALLRPTIDKSVKAHATGKTGGRGHKKAPLVKL